MRRVGEAVHDRDRRVLGELVDLRLVERPDRDRAQEAREDERGVARRLPARELEISCRDVQRHPAQLGDPDLGADPRARRGLAEDEADRPARQDPQLTTARALDLELVREVESGAELNWAPGGDPREAPALECVGDAGHGTIVLSQNLLMNPADYILVYVRTSCKEETWRHSYVGSPFATSRRCRPRWADSSTGSSRAAAAAPRGGSPRSTCGRPGPTSSTRSICPGSRRARSGSRSRTTRGRSRASGG